MSTEHVERRLWDWRFIVSLIVLASVSWVIFTGIQAQQSQVRARARISQLLTNLQVNQHRDQLNTANQEAATLAFEANQRLLIGYVEATAARSTDLLNYLHRHGIKIPQRFLVPLVIPQLQSVNPSAATPKAPKASAPPKKVKKRPKVHKRAVRHRPHRHSPH